MNMKQQYGDDQFIKSRLMNSYDTTPERYSSLSEPVSLFHSPSSSDDHSPSFKTYEEDSEIGHEKKPGRKSSSFAHRICEHGKGSFYSNPDRKICYGSVRLEESVHVKMGHKLSETVKGKVRLGARIIQEGGRENIFRQIFGMKEGEKMLKASQCYLSTTAGPIAGLLFISTEKVAFCSERSITLSTPCGEVIRTLYKVLIPVSKIKRANQSENVNNPSQKYIEIVTEDDFEFWFMGFIRYEKALANLQKAISSAN